MTTFQQFQDAMADYAAMIQADNYIGDDYYNQECWREPFNEGRTPEQAVTEDMDCWD